MTWEMFKDPTLIWFFIGLLCVIGEFSLPGVIIVFFGVGAWTVALLTYFTNISIPVQVILFIVISIVSLISLRKKFYSPQSDDPDVTDDFLGKTAVVLEPVSKGRPGKVTFKGAAWKAETLSDEPLEQGRYVRIVNRESIVLYVEAIRE